MLKSAAVELPPVDPGPLVVKTTCGLGPVDEDALDEAGCSEVDTSDSRNRPLRSAMAADA